MSVSRSTAAAVLSCVVGFTLVGTPAFDSNHSRCHASRVLLAPIYGVLRGRGLAQLTNQRRPVAVAVAVAQEGSKPGVRLPLAVISLVRADRLLILLLILLCYYY